MIYSIFILGNTGQTLQESEKSKLTWKDLRDTFLTEKGRPGGRMYATIPFILKQQKYNNDSYYLLTYKSIDKNVGK